MNSKETFDFFLINVTQKFVMKIWIWKNEEHHATGECKFKMQKIKMSNKKTFTVQLLVIFKNGNCVKRYQTLYLGSYSEFYNSHKYVSLIPNYILRFLRISSLCESRRINKRKCFCLKLDMLKKNAYL